MIKSNNPHPDGTSPFDNLAGENDKTGPKAATQNSHQANGHSDFESELKQALSPGHLQSLLQESSISPEVVKARGYRTVRTKAELGRLGFSGRQHNPPGLLIPIYSPTGNIATYQFRPDEPRIKDGKPIRYEMPARSRMMLDVHPLAREKLGDPSIPLFVTEGVKKGDALVSRGLCAVTLLGVWNWRGTNEQGGKAVLAEWEFIAFNDRRVYIVFDSDVMINPQVHAALARLKNFLEVR